MLLALDIGNTEITGGLFAGTDLVAQWRFTTVHERTPDEWAALFLAYLAHSGRTPGTVRAAVIGSVAPTVAMDLAAGIQLACGVTPVDVGPSSPLPITLDVDEPLTVGADRVVNTLAAHALFARDTVVVDFGTATTFDCISAKGDYIGGVIVPGISISLEALVQMASKLPRVEIVRPRTVIGKNTVHGMQSGILYGYVSLVDGMVDRIRKEMGEDAFVIATGGLAERVAPESHTIQEVDEFLTLKGLQILHQLNRKEA